MEKTTADLLSLQWKTLGTHKLEQSQSKIVLPDNYRILIGAEARRAIQLMEVPQFDHPGLEAVINVADSGDLVIFEYLQAGYVSLDDWQDLNPQKLMVSLKRRKNNIVGWMQEPLLDKQTNSVSWALETQDDSRSSVQTIILKLGREGFERLSCLTSTESYVTLNRHLEELFQAHSFDAGYKYEEHKSDDKSAGIGISTLVTVVTGGYSDEPSWLDYVHAFLDKLKSLFSRTKNN